jgi:hypothetical protein
VLQLLATYGSPQAVSAEPAEALLYRVGRGLADVATIVRQGSAYGRGLRQGSEPFFFPGTSAARAGLTDGVLQKAL